MRVLFATAELTPFVKVGGLADFSAGLVTALRREEVSVEVILPDYGRLPFDEAASHEVAMPAWATSARAREGELAGFPVTLVSMPEMTRPHPYIDADGEGWPNNDRRFFSFAAAIASWASQTSPDIIHLNDWHTGPVLGFLSEPPPSVLTIHNLAYQGVTSADWLLALRRRPEAFEWYGDTNPLTGAIALADRVVTVSPTFARESLDPATSFGLSGPLEARGTDFIGILNGIDTDVWNPATDPHLTRHYDSTNVSTKRLLGRRLVEELGWAPSHEPLIGMVTRLTGQKGVDIALEMALSLDQIGARMVLLGSGERALADAARYIQERLPDRFVFREGYDEGLSHRIFGGADLYLMPSRFEPAGLTQMQAMRYGTIPVVTDVGGLHDTVIDADEDPENGTGFVSEDISAGAMTDALDRAVRAWRSTRRRGRIRRNGMEIDWSWNAPARTYLDLYRELSSAR